MRYAPGSVATTAGLLLCVAAAPVEAQYNVDLKTSVQLIAPSTQAAVAQLNTEIASLREAQERCGAAQGRYTEDIKALVGYSPPPANSIIMTTASNQEWAAVGTNPEVVGVVIARVRRVAAGDSEGPLGPQVAIPVQASA